MECISLNQLMIDPDRFIVVKEGKKIRLTKTEFLILYLMMSTKGKINSREDIALFAWGVESLEHPRTIDTHISNIRTKIGKVKDKDIITFIKGVGYKLEEALLD